MLATWLSSEDQSTLLIQMDALCAYKWSSDHHILVPPFQWDWGNTTDDFMMQDFLYTLIHLWFPEWESEETTAPCSLLPIDQQENLQKIMEQDQFWIPFLRFRWDALHTLSPAQHRQWQDLIATHWSHEVSLLSFPPYLLIGGSDDLSIFEEPLLQLAHALHTLHRVITQSDLPLSLSTHPTP